MSTISLILSDKDDELFKNYAELNNISLSQLIRESVLERIENEIDIELFEKAYSEMSRTYAIEEVRKELVI